MYWQDALSGSMEIAIAIAGFSGIVAVFGRRNDDFMQAADHIRLSVLLTASAVAVLFSLAPFVVLDAGVPEFIFWRVGSAVQGAWIISIALYRMKQAQVSGVASVMHIKVMVSLMLLVVIAQVTNALFYGQSWLYVIGVAFQLAVAFSSFSGLLLDRWKDNEESP